MQYTSDYPSEFFAVLIVEQNVQHGIKRGFRIPQAIPDSVEHCNNNAERHYIRQIGSKIFEPSVITILTDLSALLDRPTRYQRAFETDLQLLELMHNEKKNHIR